jgi:hypothetical protein
MSPSRLRIVAWIASAALCIPLIFAAIPSIPAAAAPPAALPAIQNVFVIVMENHNWADIKGSASAPYINQSLLPIGAHAEQYFNPPGNHPSEPNYLWLEAGTNFGIRDDNEPSINHQGTTQHLSTLLTKAGISWKSYQEGIDGKSCPLTTNGLYVPKHDPFVFFDDVTDANSPSSATCIAHVRPYPELATDLANNATARYNFITPDLCDDMHNNTGCATTDALKNGDTWLSQNVPAILNSAAYKNNGALFITWDEGEGSDGPIGLIALSPLARAGYANTIHYTHSSTLRTFEEIFGVTPLLGDAANATDLSDLFASGPPTVSADPQQVPFGQNTTAITFSSGPAANGTVCVAANGGAEAPFTGGASGSQAFPFVNSGAYVFNLRSGSGCSGAILATTTVAKQTPNGTLSASTTATPATLSFATSTTQLIRSSVINFDSGDGSVVQLMLSVNGSAPQVFAAAQFGTKTAPWIFSGTNTFTLVKNGQTVSTATVQTTAQISSPNGTTAGGPSPNVTTAVGKPVPLTFDTGTGQPAALCTNFGGLVSFSQNGTGNADSVDTAGSVTYSLHIGDCTGALATPGTVTVTAA